MVSTKIQNNKTSASAVPSAEWNWIGDLFNSTTQNTSFTVGTGTIASGAIFASRTINAATAITADNLLPNTSTGGINFRNSNGVTVLSISSGAAASTSSTITGNLSISGQVSASTLNATNITSTTFASFKNYVHGNTGTATTINWNNGSYQSCTLTGNCTFVFTGVNIPSGDRIRMTLYLAQDNVGSRTATWPTSVRWSGSTAPTLTTTGTVTDIATFIYDGNRYAGVMSTNVPL